MQSPLSTHPAARDFIYAMRNRAIADFCDADQRALDAIRRDPSINHGRPDSVSIAEQTALGELRCHATHGPVTRDGIPTFRAHFTLDGRAISLVDAEDAVAAQLAGGAA